MNEINATIHFRGEPCVGIFPATWELTGGLIFDDKTEREEFREKLIELFELQTGERCSVEFSDERETDPLEASCWIEK